MTKFQVKTLVCGVKTITWGCTSCKTDATPTVAGQPVQVKILENLTFKLYPIFPNKN